jgi:hypothetical protein
MPQYLNNQINKIAPCLIFVIYIQMLEVSDKANRGEENMNNGER